VEGGVVGENLLDELDPSQDQVGDPPAVAAGDLDAAVFVDGADAIPRRPRAFSRLGKDESSSCRHIKRETISPSRGDRLPPARPGDPNQVGLVSTGPVFRTRPKPATDRRATAREARSS
jgi:hypothetical protein